MYMLSENVETKSLLKAPLKFHATIPQFIISCALTKILLPNNGSLMSRDYLVFKTHKCDLYEVFDGNPLDMPSSRCYIRN